ncbi:4889_t:CDS:2 [Diversispora eburnea]|uniref:4889_t:CDS:1 n=1 Tax=Diversispora eburnea TaxID=1213867 RepID=A0A9N9C0P1_9GLOM|nr:4889_t:CDS:2 [Diversispora eburnea]
MVIITKQQQFNQQQQYNKQQPCNIEKSNLILPTSCVSPICYDYYASPLPPPSLHSPSSAHQNWRHQNISNISNNLSTPNSSS